MCGCGIEGMFRATGRYMDVLAEQREWWKEEWFEEIGGEEGRDWRVLGFRMRGLLGRLPEI